MYHGTMTALLDKYVESNERIATANNKALALEADKERDSQRELLKEERAYNAAEAEKARAWTSEENLKDRTNALKCVT